MTQIEVELKILDIDLPRLICALESIGAHRQQEKTLFDIYYDTTSGDSLKSSNKGLRVRHVAGKEIVTLKKRITSKKDTVKQAYETEFVVSGNKDTKKLVAKHGVKPQWMKYKKRITYIHGDIVFDIDLYPGIPPVLEIEAATEKDIQKRIKKLGIQKKDQSVSGTRGLFRRYGKQPLRIV